MALRRRFKYDWTCFDDFHLEYLGTELGGEILYNNPVNFVLAIIATVLFFRGKLNGDKTIQRLVVCTALPLILLFWFFALTRPTLPHWNSPAHNLLVILSAIMLSNKTGQKTPKPVIASVTLLAIVLIFGIVEIKAVEEGVMTTDSGIIAHKWFPLANLDYYVARPLDMKAFGLGPIEDIHKYQWINQERGGLQLGNDYRYITDSHYYNAPLPMFKGYFESIMLVDTICIERCGKPAKNFFVYTCKNLNKLPQSKSSDK